MQRQYPWKFPRPFLDRLAPGKDKTQHVPFILSPKWGVKSGTARITRWRPREQGGAGSRRPHLAVTGLQPPAGLQLPDSPRMAAARRTRRTWGPPAAPPLRAAITGSHRAFSQARTPRPFCVRRRPGRGAQRWLHRAPIPRRPPKSSRQTRYQLRLPHAPRVWWRPRRHRRALPVSGSAVTRAALAPPRATSPAPRAGRSFGQQRGLGMPRSPPGPDQARRTGGLRVKAAVTKRLLCRPARPAAAASPVRALRAGPAPPPAPPRAREGRGNRCLPRPTATLQSPASGSPQPAATGRPQGRSLVPYRPGPTETADQGGGERTPGSEQRRQRDGGAGVGGRSWSPGPRGGGATDTHRNMFTH